MKENHLKRGILIFAISMLLCSCQKEDSIEQDNNYFKTVELNRALDFISQTQQSQNRSASENYIISIVPDITYEDITNSEEQLAVIPVTTIYNFLNSRLTLLEINGEIQSVVISLNPFENSTDSEFYGEILITDTNGNFIKAFKMENNLIVSEYFNNITLDRNSSSIFNRNSTNETDGSCVCPFSVCDWCMLDEVVIESSSPPPPTTYVSISHMYPVGGGNDQGNCEVGCDNNWNFGGGGGSGSDGGDENIDINDIVSIEEQNITRICSNYQWKGIGNAQYANISNLYIIIVARGIFSDKIIEVNFSELCISIPYASSISATNIFNEA